MYEVHLFKRISHTKWRVDREAHIRFYLAFIKHKVDYGSEAYS